MQFDEKDFEKNNDDFSLDLDNQGVSWESLLNTEEATQQSTENPNDRPDGEEQSEERKINAEPAYDKPYDTEAAYDKTDDSEAAYDVPAESSIDFSKDAISDDQLMQAVADSSLNVTFDSTASEMASIVDKELLDLLDSRTPAPTADISAMGETTSEPVELADNSVAEEESPSQLPVSGPVYSEESYADNFVPTPSQKEGSKPVFLILTLVIAGLFTAAVLAVYFFFPNLLSGGNVASDTLPTPDESMYGTELPSAESSAPEAEQPQKTVSAENAEKQDLDKDKGKEDKEDKANKKSKLIVQVPVGGRANPFVPSALFDDQGFAKFGGDLSLPPDTSISNADAAQGRALMSIGLSGIMYDSSTPSAIIKISGVDYFVRKGDSVEGFKIVDITRDYVSIGSGSNIYKAYVGNMFTAEAVSQDESNSAGSTNASYISANDIEVN